MEVEKGFSFSWSEALAVFSDILESGWKRPKIWQGLTAHGLVGLTLSHLGMRSSCAETVSCHLLASLARRTLDNLERRHTVAGEVRQKVLRWSRTEGCLFQYYNRCMFWNLFGCFVKSTIL